MAAFKVLAAEGSFVQYSRQEKMSGARASEKCRLRRRSSFVHAGEIIRCRMWSTFSSGCQGLHLIYGSLL